MTDLVQRFFDKRGFGYGALAGAVTAVLLGLMARGIIDHVPLYDELLHFLAAQGLQRSGTLAIADGEYPRAWLYTHLVAKSFTVFGETLVAARIPALISAMGLVLLTAVWVTRKVGLFAGLIAAGFLCLAPATIDLAVFARFYTLHALVITVMGIALYEALDPESGRVRRVTLVALAFALTPLAMHLQESTVVAAGALACGTAAVLMLDHWMWIRGFARRYPLQLAVGGILALAVALVVVNKLGLIDQMQQVPLWNAWAVGRPHYYLMVLASEMPLLWALFPVAIVLAFTVQARLTLFAVVVLVSGLAVHSIAGQKAIRYVYYLFPFFCVIWGCALAAIAQFARSIWERRQRQIAGYTEFFVLTLMFLVLVNSREGQSAAKLIGGRVTPEESLGLTNIAEPEWRPIVPILKPVLAEADRSITSNAMKSLYYFGNYDYELNASIVPETITGTEFGIDHRTGKQAIGSAESIKRVLSMSGAAVVVLEDEKMNLEAGVPPDAMAVIEAFCKPIPLPADVAVHAWSCLKP